jgi:hypothetical protein
MRTLVLLSLVASLARPEIIDRIAVTLDNQVITESEILREIRLTDFLNGEPLAPDATAKRQAADRLVEQKLIRKEIELGHYAAPPPGDVEQMLKQVQTQRFRGLQEYTQALKEYGITEDDVRAHLLWQATLLRFIDVRFRPAIQISDDEIRKYYDQELPALEKQTGRDRKINLDELREKIHARLTDERIDKQMDEWLVESKKRVRLNYRAEVLQ